MNLGGLYAINHGLHLIVFLFDTIVIDGIVIGHWRPAFLETASAMSAESMREHIEKSIAVGTLFGLIINLLCTVVSF